mgnify:CR=1 FL=1
MENGTVIERTGPQIQWSVNVWQLVNLVGSALVGIVTSLFTSPLAALGVFALLISLGFFFLLQVTHDPKNRLRQLLRPEINEKNPRANRHENEALRRFKEKTLCGKHEITTDGRVVSHVGNPTGSFTTPNGPRSRHGERVIFVCNYCHAAGELVRLADGRQGLLHRATDGPVEVVAVYPEPTAFGK